MNEEVIDYVEKRVQSKHQETDSMINFLQKQHKKFEEALERNEQNAIDNRKVFKTEMMDITEKTIKTVVNGKIDRTNIDIVEIKKEVVDIKTLITELKPLIEERTRKKHFREEVMIIVGWLKWVLGTVLVLGGMRLFVKDVLNFLIK